MSAVGSRKNNLFARRARAAILASAAALVMSACTLPAPMLQDTGGVPTPEVDDGLEEFYDQSIAWSSCGRHFECGSVTVPIDYANPSGGTIDIKMKKFTSSSARGTILINPGGPGGSGIEAVEAARDLFTNDLRAAREIIGFDPRGVGQSAPITCFDADELDELYSTSYDVETEEGWNAFNDDTREYLAACQERNPDTIGFVDTVSAARDMDIIRAALDQEKLDYLGFSYGTKLGATYADLFPSNVGRFVLDGAMDLTLDHRALGRGQVQGFEAAYRAYLADCLQGPNCPFSGTVENAYEDTLALFDDLALRPAETADPDRPVTEVDLLNTIVLSLYSTMSWQWLSTAIGDLQQDDGTMVRFLSDYAMERKEDGTYAPGDGAMAAIDCLDRPMRDEPDWQELRALEQEYEELSPIFGPSIAYAEVGCWAFPIKTDYGPRALSATGAPTMVVIGTTGDPATPYEWSKAMVEQLDDAVLLTYDGHGHTAYGKGSCIDDAVDNFFIRGILPKDGLTC